MKNVIDIKDLNLFVEENAFECDDSPAPPPSGEVKKVIYRFAPKWRRYQDKPGTEIIINSGVNECELSVEPIEDASLRANTEVNLKLKVSTKDFSAWDKTRYSIELPPEYEQYWPLDGLDEGGAVLWYLGGRNTYVGECFWTNRDNTPWHLIFVFAEHGEWEKGHPVDLRSISGFKLRASITYRIKL